MPPFTPGWILLQVSRSAPKTLPQRATQRVLCQACSAFSTSAVTQEDDFKPDEKESPHGFKVRVFDQNERGGRLRRRRSDIDEVDPLEEEFREGLPDDAIGADGDPEKAFRDAQDFKKLLEDDRFSLPAEGDSMQKFLGQVGEGEAQNMDALDRMLQESDIFAHQIEPNGALPRQSQLYLDKLNSVMDLYYLKPDGEKTRRQVWVWYERCKANVPNFLHIIPKSGWDLLRQSQSEDGKGFEEQTIHLGVLAKDKTKAGWDLTDAERIAQLEGDFMQNRESSALEEWETLRAEQADMPLALFRSGIRMHAMAGNLERADVLATELFRKQQDADPFDLCLPIIWACCTSDPPDVAMALKYYAVLRDQLGSRMTVAEYDEVSHAFLSIGEKDAALAVFRDMMLAGESQMERNSAGPLRRLKSFVAINEDPQDTNRIHLQTMKWLPRRFQNKIFYASWMKKLLGEGQLKAAALVIDLMYERGLRPDAKHMNGLLTAWMREGTPYAREQAESRGWAMIQNRLNFVAARAQTKDGCEHKPVLVPLDRLSVKLYTQKKMPSATIETFCIMAQFYLRRSMFEHVRCLRDLLDAAEIPMNSFFMNHLLHAELRNRGPQGVWSRFNFTTRTVRPDMESYMILWEALHRDFDGNRRMDAAKEPPFASPRQLFAKMMEWFESLTEAQKSEALEEFNVEGLNDVMSTFSLAKDIEGALVALSIMHTQLGQQADKRVGHSLIMLVARLDVDTRVNRGKSRSARNRNQENVNRASGVLRQIQDQRRKLILEAGGVDPWPESSIPPMRKDQAQDDVDDDGVEYRGSEFTQKELGAENTKVLLTFLYVVIQNRRDGEERTMRALSSAMEEMGVRQFDLNEAMSLSVKA